MIVDINCNELQPHALTIILWCALWCNIPLLLQIEMIKMYNLKMNLSIVCWHVPDWFTSAVLDDSSKQQTFSMDPAASRKFKLDSVSKKIIDAYFCKNWNLLKIVIFRAKLNVEIRISSTISLILFCRSVKRFKNSTNFFIKIINWLNSFQPVFLILFWKTNKLPQPEHCIIQDLLARMIKKPTHLQMFDI